MTMIASRPIDRLSLKITVLMIVCIIAFACRVFSVLRYESVIHEFDPYFNYRTTKYIQEHGFAVFWNWFDEAAWYPLGRVVGQTLFPGLMVTATMIWWLATKVGIMLDIREICVFTAPLFSMGTSIATYKLTKTATDDAIAGIMAALIIAVCPSYLSRSTAGGFDNEAIAIFTLVLSFYTFLRACAKGTIGSVLAACFAYFYMVTVWGGYVFITNTVAFYVTWVLIRGRMDQNIFIAYAGWYALGTMWCFNIPFVGLAAIKSAEHISSHVAFLLIMLWYAYCNVQITKRINSIIFAAFITTILITSVAIVYFGLAKFGGRSLTLLDPSYATKHVPIIASISEHQPPTWSVWHSELGPSFVLAPAGIFLCMIAESKITWFLGIYTVVSTYFSAVMIRLTLVLAPACACVAGVAASKILKHCRDSIRSQGYTIYKLTALISIGFIALLFYQIVTMGVFSAAVIYSSPSIVTAARLTSGEELIIDDLREAYHWMSKNTHPESKILSWWDYGYQAAYMANRSVIVDNNTWNTTHIATVGLALASPEEVAFPILQHLDADYVFVLFGGVARFSGDDLNKFVWIIRIASREFSQCPKEKEFLSSSTRSFDVGRGAAPALKNSVMYKLSYHQFARNRQTMGEDLLRMASIPDTVELKYFTEVYTTTSYMVRIYRVNKPRERLSYGAPPLIDILPQ